MYKQNIMQCLINCTQAGCSCYALQHVADGDQNLGTTLLIVNEELFSFFYVLLTVHLDIIL